jgi:hypothetical protein
MTFQETGYIILAAVGTGGELPIRRRLRSFDLKRDHFARNGEPDEDVDRRRMAIVPRMLKITKIRTQSAEKSGTLGFGENSWKAPPGNGLSRIVPSTKWLPDPAIDGASKE